MIDILKKENCCGCSACAQICPKQCINMSVDNEGFLYPKVDVDICVDCHICEKVCPVLNQNEPSKPLSVYAANNKNHDIRLKSSSGGIFTVLAESIITEGGVVFGARFDADWNVVHDYTETIEGLEPFRGSKYVQSTIGDNFTIAKHFLSDGRKVMFSGTPCQIAGLKKFLRKEYDNLLTVEVVCHGVPSPMVWRDYLNYKRAQRVAGKNTVSSSLNELPIITGISFRDKTNGWKKYGFKICFAASKAAENSVSKSVNTSECEIVPHTENLFMKGFLKNLYLRPSCYNCASRQGKSGAEISIADFWGVWDFHTQMYDDKGTGLILVNNEKGANILKGIINKLYYMPSDYDKAIISNGCIVSSVKVPKYRDEFWKLYDLHKIGAIEPICKKIKLPLFIRCKILIRHIIKKMIGI